jgi:hypothetical protein
LVSKWVDENKLVIAPEKYHVTLFPPWNREINKCPQVFYNGILISVNTRPKFLGLTLDGIFNLTPHAGTGAEKGLSRLQLPKATSGQEFKNHL